MRPAPKPSSGKFCTAMIGFARNSARPARSTCCPTASDFRRRCRRILAHSGVKGFSTQKLVWGSSAPRGGPESLEKTPEGTPFNVGVWVGPDGESVLAGLNPGAYDGGIDTDLSKPLPPLPPDAALQDVQKKMQAVRAKLEQEQGSGHASDPNDIEESIHLRSERAALTRIDQDRAQARHQGDWAARVYRTAKSVAYSRTITITARAILAGLRARNM